MNQILQQQRQGDENPFDTVRRYYLQETAEHTGRNTILYSTNWTEVSENHPEHSIQRSDIHGFMESVSGFESHDTLDLIIHSPGGSPEAAEQIVDYIRAKFDDFRIIVPEIAMSAASLMCCAADSVVMGSHSSLGPVDPQIRIRTPLGPRQVPAYCILGQFDTAREDFYGEGDVGPWNPILPQYGPSLLAECEDAIELSQELAETWSMEYMFSSDPDKEEKAAQLSTTLGSRNEFKSHGRPISRKRADELGFNVEELEADDVLQDLILSTFHATMHMHNSVGVPKLIENHKGNFFIPGLKAGADSEDSD